MKKPTCPCPKKRRRKTNTQSRKVSIPAAAYNKFAGVTAPMLANTSGTFNIPGFAPIRSFPFPGLTVGNANQFDGLLPGSGRADMIAAAMYRFNDKKDDVSSGPGATGLNAAPKGNINARRVNMNASEPLVQPIKIEGQLSVSDVLKRQRLAQEAARFYAYNPGLGESKENPIQLDTKSLPPSSLSANQITQPKKQPVRVAVGAGVQKRTGQVFPG